ncbi:MAG: 4-hydroxy-tetrahydrodipicolinate reductase [Candidatus Omnitrophica bacterium]|nr:4-hydroxy-tetrahydrodipicolinate reductase [Candidatus Omnitrophota bacterium]
MTRIIISGVCGRMGRRIADLAYNDKDFEIAGALEARDNPNIGKDIGEVIEIGKLQKRIESDFDKINEKSCVLIEFTSPESTMEHLESARGKKMGVVIGTTALSLEQIENIKDASKVIPIVFSPNMSIGANVLFKITEEVSRMLDEDYEIKIVEAHHTKKKDAPSGTAKRLGEAVSKVRGTTPPIESIREGDIVGDHTVIFNGKYETIEVKHSAHSRDVFAKGALDAARFVAGKKTGLYTMYDVIG